ncbi:hypothetical protein GGF46_004211 [Coemansia sp. RSA 552]|nr:hypothetical protein GGF46_004211 [Coemansia sp. RSA 552]
MERVYYEDGPVASNIELIVAQGTGDLVQTLQVDTSWVVRRDRFLHILLYPIRACLQRENMWPNVRRLEFCDFNRNKLHFVGCFDHTHFGEAAKLYRMAFSEVTSFKATQQPEPMHDFMRWLLSSYAGKLGRLDFGLPIALGIQLMGTQLTRLDFCVRNENHYALSLIHSKSLQHLRLVEIPKWFDWGAFCLFTKAQSVEFADLKTLTLEFAAPTVPGFMSAHRIAGMTAQFPKLSELRIRNFANHALVLEGMRCPWMLQYLQFSGDNMGISQLCSSGVQSIHQAHIYSDMVVTTGMLEETCSLQIKEARIMDATNFALSDILSLISRVPDLDELVIDGYVLDGPTIDNVNTCLKYGTQHTIFPFDTGIEDLELINGDEDSPIPLLDIAIYLAIKIPLLKVLVVDVADTQAHENFESKMSTYTLHHPHLRSVRIMYHILSDLA